MGPSCKYCLHIAEKMLNAEEDEVGGFFYDEDAASLDTSGRAAALEHLDSLLQVPQTDELDEVDPTTTALCQPLIPVW